jgi:AcrR family transcriptional regulator
MAPTQSARTKQRSAKPAPATGSEATADGERAQSRKLRRDAILAAALAEFSLRGFAATRLDDVARRANVAKGTIYLYFSDKQSLFQELVRSALGPLVDAIAAASARDISARVLGELIVKVFVEEIYGTVRKDVIRLVITEGQHFPELAEFYYREVIARVLPIVRRSLQRAVERGELSQDALARFPQLLVAPALVAIIWSGLFERFSPLDVRGLMRAHLELLFGGKPAS